MTTVAATPSISAEFVSSWFNDEDTSDIEVLLKNSKKLHCHRVLLRSWSTVWAAALTDKKEVSLDMTAHDAAAVKLCMKYCYNLPIVLTDENLTRVHLFAYQYNLEELKSKCELEMTEGISVENCMSLYSYLLKHSFPSMPNALKAVTDFVHHKFVSAVKSEGFLTIDAEALCRLLAGPISVDEDDVLDACNRWLGASPDPQARERVLKLVRFPMLSASKLLELRTFPWFQPDLEPRYDIATRWRLTALVADSGRRNTLRAQLERENKLDDHLTRRGPFMQLESKILNGDMKRTLALMIGESRVGRLLLDNIEGTLAAGETVAHPLVFVIQSSSEYVFGAYIEDEFFEEDDGDWTRNNFLFSLNFVPPQRVAKLTRTDTSFGMFDCLKRLTKGRIPMALVDGHSTRNSPSFELAPGYEDVGTTMQHGEFGEYNMESMEVFTLSVPKCVSDSRPSKKRKA